MLPYRYRGATGGGDANSAVRKRTNLEKEDR
jgi:hypothetical protein